MPNTIGQFKAFIGSTPVEYNSNTQELGKSTVQPKSFLGRMWILITGGRSAEQKTINKQTTQAFIDALKEKYGDKIGDFATRDITSRLKNGRPLTGRRIQKVIAQAKEAKLWVRNHNMQFFDKFLNSKADELVDLALKEKFELGNKEAPLKQSEREELLDYVKEAVVKHRNFWQSGSPTDTGFNRKMQTAVRDAVDGFYHMKAQDIEDLPNVARVTQQDGTFPDHKGTDSKISHIGLGLEVGQPGYVLYMGFNVLRLSGRNMQEFLNLPEDTDQATLRKLGNRTGISRAIDSFEKVEMEHPEGLKFLNALKIDGQALLGKMDEMLGIDEFDREELEDLTEVYEKVAEVDDTVLDLTAGLVDKEKLDETYDRAMNDLISSRDMLVALKNEGSDKADSTIDHMLKYCNELIGKLEPHGEKNQLELD